MTDIVTEALEGMDQGDSGGEESSEEEVFSENSDEEVSIIEPNENRPGIKVTDSMLHAEGGDDSDDGAGNAATLKRVRTKTDPPVVLPPGTGQRVKDEQLKREKKQAESLDMDSLSLRDNDDENDLLRSPRSEDEAGDTSKHRQFENASGSAGRRHKESLRKGSLGASSDLFSEDSDSIAFSEGEESADGLHPAPQMVYRRSMKRTPNFRNEADRRNNLAIPTRPAGSSDIVSEDFRARKQSLSTLDDFNKQRRAPPTQRKASLESTLSVRGFRGLLYTSSPWKGSPWKLQLTGITTKKSSSLWRPNN